MEIRTAALHENHLPSVEVRLRDNGPGIPPDQVERLFQPYVTTKTKGTGLGLAIVKKIVEEHGGTIYHDAGYRAGAGFVIRLPALEASDIELETPND